jgi:hypothetical protein
VVVDTPSETVERPLPAPPRLALAPFSFSPDGSSIVFEERGKDGPDIYTMSVASGAIRRLTTGGRSAYG